MSVIITVDDVKSTLNKLDAFNIEKAVLASVITEKLMIQYDKLKENENISDKDDVFREYYKNTMNILWDLHKQRITVYGFESEESCYRLWYICKNPPSTRRSFGNFNGHGNWWDGEDK